jgi:glutathione S-transferase
MKLFYSPAACSLASHIALREAGIPFELERVDLATKTTDTGMDFTTVSAKGYVPALALDDGSLLTEGIAILLWIAGEGPEKGLAPLAGTMEYIRLLEWLAFISTEIHKGFSPLFNPAIPEAAKSALTARLFGRLAYVDDELTGRAFLMGDKFSVADIYLFTTLRWLAFFQVELTRWPNLAVFFERIAARPAVKDALAAEGLS